MLKELKQSYASITKLKRMKIKDGSPLNAVRADFKSKDKSRLYITFLERSKLVA